MLLHHSAYYDPYDGRGPYVRNISMSRSGLCANNFSPNVWSNAASQESTSTCTMVVTTVTVYPTSFLAQATLHYGSMDRTGADGTRGAPGSQSAPTTQAGTVSPGVLSHAIQLLPQDSPSASGMRPLPGGTPIQAATPRPKVSSSFHLNSTSNYTIPKIPSSLKSSISSSSGGSGGGIRSGAWVALLGILLDVVVA